jgi:hypothetical protein
MSVIKIKETCSLGHLCFSSFLLKTLNIKKESYPFDWIFSNLNIIKHCIEDKFKTFLDKKYYTRICNKNITNKRKMNLQRHIYYFPNGNIMFNHHNPINTKDYNYFLRCVNRFKILLKKKSNKLFIYYHKNYENKPFDENNKLNIIEFNNFLKMHTKNYTILSIYVQKSNTSSLDYIKYENIDFVNINIIGGMNGVKFTNQQDANILKNFIKKRYLFSLIEIKKQPVKIKPKITDGKKQPLKIKPKLIEIKKQPLKIKPKIKEVKKQPLKIKPNIKEVKKQPLQNKSVYVKKETLKLGLKLFIKSKK